ncbi:pyridoxamine 5'-phosphate oxidase family protein, partial [Kibdelosporangium lantanae]
RPHVVPVGVFYDPEAGTVVIGGAAGTNMTSSKKFRDARKNPDVAFIVDDLASVNPWSPRAIEIRGRAETHLTGGEEVGKRIGAMMPFDPAWIAIHPTRILTLGIDSDSFVLSARDIHPLP